MRHRSNTWRGDERRMPTALVASLATLAIFAAVLGCSSDPSPASPAPPQQPQAAPTATQSTPPAETAPPAPAPPNAPAAPAPPSLPAGSPDVMSIALASTDLGVGENRVAFGIIRVGVGPIRDADVSIQTFLLSGGGDPSTAVETVAARFERWPGGVAGVYVVDLTFDEPGEWGLGASLTLADGSSHKAGTRVQVKETTATPAVGSAAPRSANKTADDVARLRDLTTDADPEPALYKLTIADSLDAGKPILAVFATPAYCQTATCGPQLDVVKRLRADLSDRMDFIHIEVFDNPAEIRERGIAAARVSPTLTEWGLPSEPWTFVVDRRGVIAAKFEGFVGEAELREAIDAALNE